MNLSLSKIFGLFPNKKKEDLIPLLQKLQDTYSYLSEEIIRETGEYLDISINKIYGVATFYDNFRFKAPGKYHIRLCEGTACHISGSTTILSEIEKYLNIKNGETDKNGIFSLEIVSCLGSCGLAPLIKINDDFYTRLTTESIKSILAQYRETYNMQSYRTNNGPDTFTH